MSRALVPTLLIPLALCAQVSAQCGTIYQAEVFAPDCEFFPGSGAWAIAENGDMTGGYSCALGLGKPMAVFGDAFTPLPLPPGFTEGRGQDINSSMQIAGNSTDSGPERAFLYSDGTSVQLLPLPKSTRASANAIQPVRDDKVVGYSTTSTAGLTAVFWDDVFAPIQLELPMGPSSVAFDVNQSGAIVGWMGIFSIPPFVAHGFLWHKGTTTDLGVPPGCITSTAEAINNEFRVCGRAVTDDYQTATVQVQGWVWTKGKYTMIDPLPGYRRCLPKDINDDGVIVGRCEDAINITDPNLPKPAFLWKDGVMTALDQVVELPPNVGIIDAMGINNAGQIAANGKLTIQGMGVTGVALRLHPIAPVPGDVNCDRSVDVDDLLAVINNWGGPPFAAGDLNKDGTVDMLDLALVLDNWTF